MPKAVSTIPGDPGSGELGGPGPVTPPIEAGFPWMGGALHIGSILSSATGSQGASASQLFSSPSAGRRAVTVTNTESAAGTYLYVGHDSSTSTTKHRVRLDAGESITIPAGPGCDIYIYGTAGTTDYAAYEEAWYSA